MAADPFGAGVAGALRLTRLSRVQAAVAGVAAYVALYGSWQLFRWGPGERALVGDAFFYPVGVAATLAAWRASRRCAGWPRLRLAWRLVALAAALYLAGDVAQTAYEAAGAKPYPSVADGLYLGFYPAMLAAVLSFPVARRNRGERLRLGLDLAVVGLGGAALVVYAVLGPAALAGGEPLQAAFSIAYPSGDIVLLVAFGLVLLRGSVPSARRPLQVLAASIGCYVAADLVYGYVTLHDGYAGGDPVDSLWLVGIGLAVVAAALQGAVVRRSPLAAARREAQWPPYAAVAVGFALLLFTHRNDSLYPGLLLTLIALALVALVSLRQYLAQRDLLGAQGELRHQALHDALTGLPNRVLALDRAEQLLARARRDHTQVAALLLDLDGFKHVNDTFGHAAGDRLLQVVAARLRAVVRGADTVARLGGDEFMVLLDAGSVAAGPELAAERILAVLREPVELNGPGARTLSVTPSIGIAIGPRASADDLFRDADLALYAAKDAGKDRFAVFASQMQTAAEDRLALQMDLHDALGSDQFALVYQPTVDLRTGAVRGAEALLRWNHPVRGSVRPDVLIPVAEETGIVVPLGRWVLQEACRQAAEWRGSGHAIWVAVNVSPRQLDEPGFVADVRAALDASGLEAGALTLEITETTLMRDAAATARRLAELKSLGVRVAIDDFGTGYSSLAYVRQFPVDAIKIDRTFVSGTAATGQSDALVHTLIQLGKTLGLETLGEGIEEPGQLARLQREQCDLGQGFLLARPLEPAAMERFLAGGSRPAFAAGRRLRAAATGPRAASDAASGSARPRRGARRRARASRSARP
ncbi:MAG TPA: EAL domain-containing protein [Gaiellaceae bacterium]|nr:EAL domain-containing protein [Gaiellaceae bacterium]